MKQYVLYTVLVLSMVGPAYPVLAQTSRPAILRLSNLDAQAAVKRYAAAEQKASDAYQREETAQREKLIADLSALQTKMTKAGNLDEAVILKAAIVDLKAGRPALEAPAVTRRTDNASLVGEWSCVRDNEKPFPVSIFADGRVERSDKHVVGTWQVSNGQLVIKWQNGYIATYTMAEGDTLHGETNNGVPLTLTRAK